MRPMSPAPFVVESPHRISLRHTVKSHGWVGLSPWVWNEENGVLSRPDRLPAGSSAWIEVTQQSPRAFRVVADPSEARQIDVDEVRAAVCRWLSTTWDPAPAIDVAVRLSPEIATFIKDGGGRFLRGSTFYEDFVKTVCTIQISWSGTQRMVAALVDKIGDGLFPTPRQVLDAGEAVLRKRARLGFRSPQLIESTGELLRRGLMDELGREARSRVTYEELVELRGIGPYAASHMMALLHDFGRIPIDSEATRYYAQRHGLTPAEIEPFFDSWGDYRFLGHRLGAGLAP